MSDEMKDEIREIKSDVDFIKKTLVKIAKKEDKRLKRIDVARKLGVTPETFDIWKKDPAKGLPVRGSDGRWSEVEIENWLENKVHSKP